VATAAPVQDGPPQVFGGGPAPQAPSPGEVYQGPGDVYQGPGEVYQGPGDVYQGPDGGYPGGHAQGGVAPGVAPVSPGAIPDEANMMMAAIFGLVAAVVTTGLWYALATSSGKMRISTVMLVGLVIGFATAWGAGRRGDVQVVGLSVGLFVASMVVGQFMINNHFYQQSFIDDLAYEEATEGIVEDGDYTREEARALIGFSEDEWDEMSDSQQQFWVAALESDYADEVEDGWDPEADDDYGEELEAMPSSLPIGEFVANMPSYFGIWGFICLAFGGAQAYKFPAGFDE
ncbi:MAG: hypothetical protein AAFY88_07070, partial [Acidobacteriota bacterium]